MFDSLEEAIAFGKGNKDDGGIPMFRWEAVLEPRSDPPIYNDVVWVTIINRGDPKNIIERKKRPEDETRWPKQWEAFLAGEDAPLEGVPLKEFPALTPADIKNCHSNQIRTVEELAKFPDGIIKNLGGRGYSMKAAAVKFLEYREGPSTDELLARIAELEKKLGDSTDNTTKRSNGNKSTKAKRGGKQRSRPSWKGVSDSEDGGEPPSD